MTGHDHSGKRRRRRNTDIAVALPALSDTSCGFAGIIAIAVVAAVCHWLAQPVPGLGIALPVFCAAVVGRRGRADIVVARRPRTSAYVAGSMGCLIWGRPAQFGRGRGAGRAPRRIRSGAGNARWNFFMTGILRCCSPVHFQPLDIPDAALARRIPRRLPVTGLAAGAQPSPANITAVTRVTPPSLP